MTDHDTYCKTWIEKLFLLDIDTLLSPDISTVDQARPFTQDLMELDPIRDYETVSFDSTLLFSPADGENEEDITK